MCKGYLISERRACRVTRLNRGTYRYRSHKNPWTALQMRIREIAQARVRYGYRKIRVLLNREGRQVGKSLMQRLYREEGLGLKQQISIKLSEQQLLRCFTQKDMLEEHVPPLVES